MARVIVPLIALATAMGLSACETNGQDTINIGGMEATPQQWARLGQAYQRNHDTRLDSGWRVDCVESDEREDTVRCFAAITGPGSSMILHVSYYNDEGPVIELRNGSQRITEMALYVDNGSDIGGWATEDIIDQMRRGDLLSARYERPIFGERVTEISRYDVSAFDEALERLEEIRNDQDYDVLRLSEQT